jgi:hypothetical protein
MQPIDSPAPIASVRDLIDLWPSLAAFAGDIGVPYEASKAMRRRGAIASDHFVAVVNAATARGFAVTYELLAILHAKNSCSAPAGCGEDGVSAAFNQGG